MPAEKDSSGYELVEDDTDLASGLGEDVARAINGIMDGFIDSFDDSYTEIEVEIFFGGTDEQWADLTK